MNKHIVIVGAGFGGLSAAQKLAPNSDLKITVIDRRNYHLFQPLLYQVATAGLSPAEIAVPIRSLLSQYKNVTVLMEEVIDINVGEKWIQTQDEKFQYDYAILACGAQHSYFGHMEWEDLAPGLKNVEQATEIRRRILLAFELAEKEHDLNKQKKYLTFVIIGAGPTGVELAGAIGEISRKTLVSDFRNIHPSKTRIIIIEAGPRILSAFPEDLAMEAQRDLEKFGVQIWNNTRVTEINHTGVYLGKEFIEAQTVIWAAGVQPSKLNQKIQSEKDSSGRVIVEPDLSLKNFPNTFVIGDQSHFKINSDSLPGLAPVAIQQGRHVAKNIFNDLKQIPREPFHYVDKGLMATVGRTSAILIINKFKASGFFAWVVWLVVHIYYLIGFKNRLFVLFQWAWAYLTYKRGARLIVDKDWKLK